MTIGVDVHKREHHVDTATGASKLYNDASHIKAWVRQLPPGCRNGPESTAGLGIPLAEIAHKAGHSVYILSPRQVGAYRASLGCRAKTDKLDALLIRQFLETNHEHLHPFVPWKEPFKTLRKLVRGSLRARKRQCEHPDAAAGFWGSGPEASSLR